MFTDNDEVIVTEFVNSTQRSMWLNLSNMEVYLRHSTRKINGETHHFIDVANVLVYEKGQGSFTAFIDFLESLGVNIYVENVHNTRLRKWFEQRPGYALVYDTNFVSMGGRQ